MSRTFVLVSSTLVCASVACTVNGRAIGPRFGGDATAPSASSASSASSAPPTPSAPATQSAEADDNQMLTVPNVLGMPVAQAKQAIRAAGFAEAAEGEVSPTLDAHLDEQDCLPGIVCGQSPPAGQKSGRHTGVDIEVGDADQAIVIVPDLAGMTEDDADLALLHAGFKQAVLATDDSGTCTPGHVCSQIPAAGTRVKRFSFVRAVMGVARP